MTRRTWDTHSVLTDEDVHALRLLCAENSVCVLDLESASEAPVDKPGLHEWHRTSRIVSSSFTFDTFPDAGFVLPCSHPDGPFGKQWRAILRDLCQIMLANGTKVVGHNLKFDLRWLLAMTGVDLTPVALWDTMLSSHLFDENSSRKLKVRGAHYMGGDWGIDVTAAETVPWFELAEYNAGDTVATMRLFLSHRGSMGKTPGLARVFKQVAMPSLRALTRVEAHGMMLDVERTQEKLREANEESEAAREVLMEQAWFFDMKPEDFKTVSWEPGSLWFREFMDRAVDRDLFPMVEVTGTGRSSWRKGVLNRLVRLGELGEADATIPEALLRYRHGSKQAQFLRVWLNSTDEQGMVHPTYNVANVVTGRLSSSNPNAQQISRELKKCWMAPPGFWMVDADYSQIEMRIAAQFLFDLLGDNPMLQAYVDGLDLHNEIAAMVAGIDPADVTKDQRQSGKAANFGFLFGMGAAKFVDYAEDSYGVFFTRKEAEIVREAFFTRWAGLDKWHQHQRAMANRRGYVTNLFGRVRHLPKAITGDDYERSTAERQSINSPVQSTASDIMLRALSVMDHMLPAKDFRVVGTIHDSTLMWVREGREDLVSQAGAIMLDPRLSDVGVTLRVPISVDAEWGTHWSEPNEERTFSTA